MFGKEENNMPMIHLPEAVKYIIQTIEDAGFEAYAVGGCVRDSILNREPNDWDITTSATPDEVKGLFRHTVDTGLKHGTVTVIIKKVNYEITTYRIDGEYEDGRHPKEVNFTSQLSEDLKRRDFTINAMAYNDSEGLVDLFGGQADLKAGIIRCVGDARERFTEDALRIMRAVRFSAQLGYEIEEKTENAIKELAPTLSRISVERIQVELVKLLVSPHPEYMLKLHEMGLTKEFFPEFDTMMETPQNNPHHLYTVGEHTVKALQAAPPDKNVRLAMLLHDIAKPATRTTDEKGINHFYGHPNLGAEMAKKILRRLRFDNDTIDTVSLLVLYHDYGNGANITSKFTRKLIHKVGKDNFPTLLSVKRADIQAQSDYELAEKIGRLDAMNAYYEEVLQKDMCVSLKDLAVTGSDLIKAGMKPGKELGVALNKLLEIVLEEPNLNNKEVLIEHLKKWGYI